MRKPSEWYGAGKEGLRNLGRKIKEQIDESNEQRKAHQQEEDKASTEKDSGIVLDYKKLISDSSDDPPEPWLGPRPSISKEVKEFVWERDGGRCAQCGSRQNLEFDHEIPFILGGSSGPNNLQVLCRMCNRRKGARI